MNIVDIGAGKYERYSDWLSKHTSLKIFAFEPHPDNFKKLEEIKEKLDSETQKRLIIHNIAITKVNGTVPFYINNDPSSSSVLPFVTSNIRSWKHPIGRRFLKLIEIINVKSLTLQSAFDSNKINSVELLNIDTQGDAVQIIESLDPTQFTSIKQILVKAHAPGCVELYKNQCESYDVTRILKRRYFQLLKVINYSHNQEQILNFLNEPMKNRGSKLKGFAD